MSKTEKRLNQVLLDLWYCDSVNMQIQHFDSEINILQGDLNINFFNENISKALFYVELNGVKYLFF